MHNLSNFCQRIFLVNYLESLEYSDASLLALFQAVTIFRHQVVGIISLNKTNAVDGVENGWGTSGNLQSEIWDLRFLCWKTPGVAGKQPGSTVMPYCMEF